MARSRWWLAAVVAVALVGAAAGCGDGDGAGDGDAGGGVRSIDEALDHEGDDAITVEGIVLADAAGTYLCSALAESFPPQCGAPALSVVNLDLGTLDGVQEKGDVRWREQPVRLTGRMVAGVLTLDGPPATVDGSTDD